jgi:hypothetical protein
MSSFGFYQGIEDLYKENINLLTDNIRCALLTDAYTPDQTDDFFNVVSAYEITGGGYASVLLTNKSIVTNGTLAGFDADDITAWQTGSFKNARYILVYNDTGVAATSQLIALIDFGGIRNAPLSFSWNANGIFSFDSSTNDFIIEDFEDAIDPLADWTYNNNDWDKQVSPDTVPLTSDNFDSITGSWEHYVDCENAVSPYGFDAVSDANGQLSIQGSIYKEGSNSLLVSNDGTGTDAYGQLNFAGATSQRVISFWFNSKNATFSASDTRIMDLNLAGTSVVQLYVLTDGSYRAITTLDVGSSTINNVDSINNDWQHFIILWKAATAPAANDGYIYIFVDGELVASETTQDTDTKTVDTLELGNTNASAITEQMYFDEVYDDPDGAPFTVAVQQMQGRDYSMCIPAIGATVYGNMTPAAPVTECWTEFDIDGKLDITSPRILVAVDTGVTNTFFIQIRDAGASYQARYVYDTDAAGVSASSYFNISFPVTIAVYFRASSGIGADDGEIAMYFNGELQQRSTGIDNDTLDIDNFTYGINGANETCVYFMGTMRYTENESAITIKDWAAQSDSYGMGYYISPSATNSNLYRDITATGIFTCEFDIDITNLVMGNGEEFIISRLYDSSGATTIFKISLKNNGGTYQLLTEYWDSAAFQNVSTYSFTGNTAKIRVVWSEEAAAANDGWMFVYVDGELDDFVTSVSTTQTDGNRFEILLNSIDSGTYGCVFIDNIKYASKLVMLNPLDSDLDNVTIEIGDFEDDVVLELEDDYFVIFYFSLSFISVTEENKPESQSPGVSDYKIILKDSAGNKVAEFDNWLSLNFNHTQNAVSNCRFEIDGRDNRRTLFELDGQFEVWRKNDSVGLPWYIEWEGFFRTPNSLITESDDRRYVAHFISYSHLIKRTFILWPAESAQASKSGVGETVIKEIAFENIGTGALASSGRLKDHVYPGVTIEADAGNGTNWEGAFASSNMLTTIRKIANATGLVYDIVGIGDGLFEFRVYNGQRGEDKSVTTGTNPLVFSVGYGNMITPLLSINRGDEFTSVAVLGQGTEDDRQYEIVQSTAVNDSPFNDIEAVVKNTQLTDSQELIDEGLSKLEEGKKIEKLSFEVQQIKSAFYGKDYSWGTKITAQFDEYQEDIVFEKVDILVNKESSKERITTELSNKNDKDVEQVE